MSREVRRVQLAKQPQLPPQMPQPHAGRGAICACNHYVRCVDIRHLVSGGVRMSNSSVACLSLCCTAQPPCCLVMACEREVLSTGIWHACAGMQRHAVLHCHSTGRGSAWASRRQLYP